MIRINCVSCNESACTGSPNKSLESCPRNRAKEALNNAETVRRNDTDVLKIAGVADAIESEGYGIWTRVQELIEFSKRMGMKRLGIAFCTGLRKETESLYQILEKNDFDVSSVCCKVSGGCNPVGQAMVLNESQTELNIVMGLCMGHDILFQKFSEAPVTTLVVKDRVLCHNPCASLVNQYWKKKFLDKNKKGEKQCIP